MSSSSILLADLRATGLSLRVDGGKLLVSPSDAITDAQRELIRGSRDALVEELAWGEQTAILASYEPDWGPYGSILEDVAIVGLPWGGKVVLSVQEWAGIERWAQWAKDRRAAKEQAEAQSAQPKKRRRRAASGQADLFVGGQS